MNCHIQKINKQGNKLEVNVAFHVPISTDLIKSGTMTVKEAYLLVEQPTTSVVIGFSSNELQQHLQEINNGSIYEHVENIECNSTETTIEIRNRINFRYLGLCDQIVKEMKQQYAYITYSFDIS